MAHAKGITVEAEVGAIGGEEDGKLACPDQDGRQYEGNGSNDQ